MTRYDQILVAIRYTVHISRSSHLGLLLMVFRFLNQIRLKKPVFNLGLSCFMFCSAVSCHAVLFYVTQCFFKSIAVLLYISQCCFMTWCALLCIAVLFYVLQCYFISYSAILFLTVLFYFLQCYRLLFSHPGLVSRGLPFLPFIMPCSVASFHAVLLHVSCW